MIIGPTQSADGGFRRIPIRHTQIVDSETRNDLVDYLTDALFQKCEDLEWVGSSDLFPNLPEDLQDTPLQILSNICCEKFKSNPKSIRINLSKYLGILLREAVYYSKDKYNEQMIGSVRKYRLDSRNS